MKNDNNSTLKVTVFTIIFAVIFVLAIVFISQADQKASQILNTQDWFKGEQDAPVVVEEYADYECPACNVFRYTLDQLVNEYGDNIKVVYKHTRISYHTFAYKAALAAEGAGAQGKFWEMHDKLYDNQDSLSDTKVQEIAQELGLDMGKFNTEYKQQLYKGDVNADYKEAEEKGVNSTPTIFINGVQFDNGNDTVPTLEELKAQIDALMPAPETTTTTVQ